MCSMKKSRFFKVSLLLIMLTCTLLSGCTTFAWFTDRDSSSSGELEVADVGLELYYYDVDNAQYQLITSDADNETYTFHHGDTIDTGLVKIKNTSSVPALIRVASVSIGVTSSWGVGINNLSKDQMTIGMDNQWIYQDVFDDNASNAYVGNYYYNAVVPAGSEIAFVKSVDIADQAYLTKDVVVELLVEAIVYDNNPYKMGASQKPWIVPSSWTAYR